MANELTRQERELIQMLAEEAGEVVQACMKILRHGWDSYDPTLPAHKQVTNRDHLQKEFVEAAAVYDQLIQNHSIGNFNAASLHVVWQKKIRYTHHQTEKGMEIPYPSDLVNDVVAKYEEPGPINIIREQFEEWAVSKHMNITRSRCDVLDYVYIDTDRTWQGWLAAEKRKFDWNAEKAAPEPAPEPEKEQNWFALTFQHMNQIGTSVGTLYVGYPERPLFSETLLKQLKRECNMNENSTLISITWLGKGTRSEFKGTSK